MHQNKWNENKAPDPFQVSYIVRFHVQVRSNIKKWLVQKVSYVARGTFRMIKDWISNSYDIQWYNDENGTFEKEMEKNLLLP